MQIYNLSKVNRLGEPDETYGVTYWCEVAEHLEPVRFSSHNEHIKAGTKIVAEEAEKRKSPKGTEYYQLRKVKVAEDSGPEPRTATQPAATTVSAKDYASDTRSPNRNAEIRAEWSIGQAIQLLKPELGSVVKLETIEATAKKLYQMVDRVSGMFTPEAVKEVFGVTDEEMAAVDDQNYLDNLPPYEDSDAN